MNTTLMDLNQLIAVAEAILFWKEVHPTLVPDRIVKMLRSGIRNLDTGKLTEGIRLAELYDAKVKTAIAEDSELERMLSEESLIENKKLEAIGLYNFLDEEVHKATIHHSKQERFDDFMSEIDPVISSKKLADVEAWIKRANDFKAGMVAKLRQAPRQTERLVAA